MGRKKTECIIECLSLSAVMQYIAYRFLQSTMFSLYFSETYKVLTFLIVCVVGIGRFVYVICKKLLVCKGKKEQRTIMYFCISFAFLSVPFVIAGWLNNYKFLVLMPMLCLCLYGIDIEKAIRTYAIFISILLGSIIICCLSGSVRNLVRVAPGNKVWGSYGIINTSDFASYFTFILLSIWCGYGERSWKQDILFVISASSVCYLVWKLTDSKTLLFCVFLMVLYTLWEKIYKKYITDKKINAINKWIKNVAVVSFPVIFLFTIILTCAFISRVSWVEDFDLVLTGRINAIATSYLKYGIHPLGTEINAMHGVGATLIPKWSSGYTYIDTAYAMMLIRYGWIITIIIMGIWVWLSNKAVFSDKPRIAIAMAIISLHAFSEARFLDVNYNIFLIMPLCIINREDLIRTSLCIEKTRKKRTFDFVLVGTALGVLLLLSPKIISLLRSYFSLKQWDNGTQAIWSFLFCAFLIVIFLFLYKVSTEVICKKRTKLILIMSSIGVLFVLGLHVYMEINLELQRQKDRLEIESNIINQIKGSASQPLYVAEESEMYQRYFGGFSEHCFSTEELYRYQGSILIQKDPASVLNTGGNFIQISPWTTLYSYDSRLINQLEQSGFTATRFYPGQHMINLKDVAVFNDMKVDKNEKLVINGPVEIETSNNEVDQFGGVYEVKLSLSLDVKSLDRDNDICMIKVKGEAGETEVMERIITTDDFDKEGNSSITIQYQIPDTPKVRYTIKVYTGFTVIVNDICWQKLC